MDKVDAEGSLHDFIKVMWPVLEPAREFVDGWAIQAICEHLEAVTRGEIRRLLINVPPGFMKSLTINVFWPAWEWGPKQRPDLRHVSASYAESLSVRDNTKCRRLIQSELYQSMWGHVFTLDSDAKVKFDNDHTGFKMATSVGGAVVGERGDRFTIDDPHNIKDAESEAKRESTLQWLTEIVPTRINDPETSFIGMIMQRVHERDCSGIIIASELGWEHLCLPMEFEHDHPNKSHTSLNFVDPRKEDGELLWPERFTPRHLEDELKPQLRLWGGEYAVSGQLQQRPAPRGGGMFQKQDLTIIAEAPPNTRWVRGWDLAGTKKKKSPYTVGAKMGIAPDGRVILGHVRRLKGKPWEVEKAVLTCAEVDGPQCPQDLPQDPGQAGVAQKEHFAKLLQGHDFHFSPESGDKETRARGLAAQSEAGNVCLVKGSWNDAFISEAITFPASTFKDQIDACSRAYARLVKRRERLIGCAPIALGG